MNWLWADAIVGLFVTLLIGVNGLLLLKDSLRTLRALVAEMFDDRLIEFFFSQINILSEVRNY
jgi:divalent metal cation (Fe/Co/Zn/Cd) transporter